MKIQKRYNNAILKAEKGMGVIEIILIILVLVGLALIFKTQITSIANSIFTSIKTQVKSF
ncbi:MAG: Flp1 family type IVb pilin [Eubacterium sp.]